MSDVTRILSAIEDGDRRAAEDLLPLVYDELRRLAAGKLAHETPGQTLEPTALVHEAYLRLVDNARRKRRPIHGGDRRRIKLDEAAALEPARHDDLLALDEALTKLAAEDPAKADLVKLRCFGGFTVDEAAELLGISRATAKRHWTYARAWLYSEISDAEPGGVD